MRLIRPRLISRIIDEICERKGLVKARSSRIAAVVGGISLETTSNLVTCPLCRVTSNVEITVYCWKCGYRFTDTELAEFRDEPALDNSAPDPTITLNAPKLARTGSTQTGLSQIIGTLIGFAILFTPIIFLLRWCNERSAINEVKEQAAAAEARLYGHNCLSAWDGSHSQVVEAVKQSLRDPDSFKHVETRTAPDDGTGHNTLIMKFRARNGFGGMNVGFAKATINNRTCAAKIERIES